ncbi:hypothetical protein FDC27_00385 [Clostridium botulinum]|nr:hypothetical protein [Clostridium botulinum]
MSVLKQCSWNGCTKIVNQDVKYCEYHKGKYDMEQKERYKEYSARRRRDKDKKKYQDFYSSSDWKRIRKACTTECYGIDILELYRTGRVVQGERVHHIICLSDDWNSRFDICNLIYLTEKNHRIVHSHYDKEKKEKEKMQKILLGLLEKFNKEFD